MMDQMMVKLEYNKPAVIRVAKEMLNIKPRDKMNTEEAMKGLNKRRTQKMKVRSKRYILIVKIEYGQRNY